MKTKLLPNTVINFHAIYNKTWLEKTLIFLKKIYNLISIEELYDFYQGRIKLKNACHITFDDGDISFYNIVFPVLKEHQIPVSIYVSPKIIKEQTNFWFQEIRNYDKKVLKNIFLELKETTENISHIPLEVLLKNSEIDFIWKCIDAYRKVKNIKPAPCMNMNVYQIRELNESGLVTIGAHTQNHPILKNEDNENALYEISASIKELSNLLGQKVLYFAYPNGIPNMDFGNREIKILENLGVKMAFSTEPRTIKKNDNLLSIPRIGISKGNTAFIFTKLLLGNKYKSIKRIIKGKQENDFRV